MQSRYTVVDGSVDMTSADTEYSVTLPEGCCNIELKLGDAAIAWRWSAKAGVVAAGGGHPMPAGSSFSDSNVVHAKQTIYVASSSATQVLKFAFNVPVIR